MTASGSASGSDWGTWNEGGFPVRTCSAHVAVSGSGSTVVDDNGKNLVPLAQAYWLQSHRVSW